MTSELETLAASLQGCMSRDRPRFARRLKQLKQSKSPAEQTSRLSKDIADSAAIAEQRARQLPPISYPEELPISQKRAEIAQTIRDNQVTIICGETGSGKTTQLAKICLELGRGIKGLIGHTQPRRIAARTVASRIASELNSEPGRYVGFKIRFSDNVSEGAYIKLMTDGILLAETQSDKFLNQYDTIIIDEAHERSLNIDFILGYLQSLLRKRQDLKLIITSATIDPERFSKHFNNAPIVNVSGRTYPVEILYRPLLRDEDNRQDVDMQQAIVEAVDELAAKGPGDVLVFLSGERDIRETAEALRKHHPPHTEILPLFSRLSNKEQERIFQSHHGRRIILATNVAETSLTVPGIRYVVDSGFARISRFSYRTKMQRLPVEPISQASANQRAGRCGRVSAGVCIRLYAEEDYQNRPLFTEPEILRTNLASVILQMTFLGLHDIEQFPFVEKPDSRFIRAGFRLLQDLGALDEQGALTEVGNKMARLPLDPRLARIVLAAEHERSLTEILVISAALSIQDPRERPLEKQQAADEKHQKYTDEKSDFLALVNVWNFVKEQSRHLSQNKMRKLCQQEFLSYNRLRDWQEVHGQLKQIVGQFKFRPNEQPADYNAVHRALLTGLVTNVAQKTETNEYQGAQNLKANLFPGSALFGKSPKWIVSAEIVETSRVYARMNAKIEPDWIESVAPHLIKKEYYEPVWDEKSQQVFAFEKVSLYGLILVAGRRVLYSRVAPAAAREIFIQHALVRREVAQPIAFLQQNNQLVDELKLLEEKIRRQDVFITEQSIQDFYAQRLPSTIASVQQLHAWYKQAKDAEKQRLMMTKQDILQQSVDENLLQAYPDYLNFGGLKLSLSYNFSPGDENDGVMLHVPIEVLPQLSESATDWLVPALLEDKVIALIKTLPKNIRKNFVPVPNFARACMQAISPYQQRLTEALTAQLKRMTGTDIPPDAWDDARIPDHLHMTIAVMGVNGKITECSRNLAYLQGKYKQSAQAAVATVSPVDEATQHKKTWEFGEIPAATVVDRNGLQYELFPALVDEGEAVSLKLFADIAEARRIMKRGLRRLLILELGADLKYLLKNIPHIQKSCLLYGPLGKCDQLKEDVVNAALDETFLQDISVINNEQSFKHCVERNRKSLVEQVNVLGASVFESLEARQGVIKRLKAVRSIAWFNAINDIQQQLELLMHQRFVRDTPVAWLTQLPRYLKAIERRLDKLDQGAVDKDRAAMLAISPLWTYCTQQLKQVDAEKLTDEFIAFRWLIEELRVSLFAQELKTLQPVSVARLEKLKQQIKKV